MPELPEVEVLARHLQPLLPGKTIRGVQVCRAKVIQPDDAEAFCRALIGAKFTNLTRRGKYLLFQLHRPRSRVPFTLFGHLGMTGRMYLAPKTSALPKHAAVVLNLGRDNFIYEDTRYFGRLTLDPNAVADLGPEPLSADFQAAPFARALRRSGQAIKVKLLDQSLVAGIGNIYASEALFRARIPPRLAARRLTAAQVKKLRTAIRAVLTEAVRCGSTLPLNFGGTAGGLFYFGRAAGAPDYYEERLVVYDRAGRPCPRCGRPIRRIIQAARSTFYCPRCQRNAS